MYLISIRTFLNTILQIRLVDSLIAVLPGASLITFGWVYQLSIDILRTSLHRVEAVGLYMNCALKFSVLHIELSDHIYHLPHIITKK